MNNRNKIIAYIEQKQQVTPKEIEQFVGISSVMVHRYLKELTGKGILVKQGTSPRVFYALQPHPASQNLGHPLLQGEGHPRHPKQGIIDENFTLILPSGYEIEGFDGFIYWCNERDYDPEKKIIEFEKIMNDYTTFKKNGIIDATQKIASTFPTGKKFLDHLYFLNPYSLPMFGKTKIATWLFHGKQTQNKMLMRRVLEIIVPEITSFINRGKYDAVAFVPPSVPREIQFMKQLEQSLTLAIPLIKIEKIKNPIIIQQKSLKDLNDRIENASSTLVVMARGSFKKVLIIDDFTGSGATLNVIAEKMKRQGITEHVDGITITGSMNGFEVIREV